MPDRILFQDSQCLKCKNLLSRGSDGFVRCFAFPLRIPNEIWNNEFIHDKPYYKDLIWDRGILFEWREE